MTKKTKLVFLITAIVSAVFVVVSTPFAIDIADRILSSIADVLGIHELPRLSILTILAVSGIYLYFAVKQRRRS